MNLYGYVGESAVQFTDASGFGPSWEWAPLPPARPFVPDPPPPLGTLPWRVPPFNPSPPPQQKCDIALTCHNVYRPILWWNQYLGVHCGLEVNDGSDHFLYDGSGGPVNEILVETGATNQRKGPFISHPASACKCLRDYVKIFNATRIPYGNDRGNSNWVLSCIVAKCGIKINWGSRSKPIGYGLPPCKTRGASVVGTSGLITGCFCSEYYTCP
jgi:hypothetical protein